LALFFLKHLYGSKNNQRMVCIEIGMQIYKHFTDIFLCGDLYDNFILLFKYKSTYKYVNYNSNSYGIEQNIIYFIILKCTLVYL
jgi:hypothetical protein